MALTATGLYAQPGAGEAKAADFAAVAGAVAQDAAKVDAAAHADYYLKLDGVAGESQDASTNSASPLLMLASAGGKHIKSAVLFARRAGGSGDYLVVTLSDVLVSSDQSKGSEDRPVDAVRLSFAKIEMSYKPQGADGRLGSAVVAGWDVKANKKI